MMGDTSEGPCSTLVMTPVPPLTAPPANRHPAAAPGIAAELIALHTNVWSELISVAPSAHRFMLTVDTAPLGSPQCALRNPSSMVRAVQDSDQVPPAG